MTNRVKQLAKLHNRSAGLLTMLQEKETRRRKYKAPVYYVRVRDTQLAGYYNTLRQDVKQFVNDPNFERAVPAAWCLEFWHILLAGSLLSLGIAVSNILLGADAVSMHLLALFFPGILVLAWLNDNGWFLASTVSDVKDRANMLHAYLEDYVALNPSFESRLRPKGEQKLETQLENLQWHLEELDGKLEEARLETERVKALWVGIKTPSPFEIPQNVLAKLTRLEQTRLLEAVQAYRVNAWTPAASVCGMILEGRLRALCRDNDLALGGIGQMIRSLGDIGFLKGYYHKLAETGEFFRHRAAHPTSEEFDREKTTLILTSLIILVRELF